MKHLPALLVHFAGHSVLAPKQCGWKLKNGQIFNINNQVAEGLGAVRGCFSEFVRQHVHPRRFKG